MHSDKLFLDSPWQTVAYGKLLLMVILGNVRQHLHCEVALLKISLKSDILDAVIGQIVFH